MPSKDDLEVENLIRSNAKLILEAEKLRKEIRVSPAVPLYISMLSALAATAGLIFSAYSQQQQSRFQATQAIYRTQQDAVATLHAAAEMATDSHAPADRRISGVYQLVHYWSMPEQEDVTAATLTAILAAGDAHGYARVRCAAASGIGAAIEPPKGGWIRDTPQEQERRERVSHLLYGYGSKGQRGLVSDLNQRLTYAAGQRGIDTDRAAKDGSESRVRLPKSVDDVIQCGSAIGATIEAIRQNWEQLRDVNLAGTNLRYAQLYQADLAHTNFHAADLTGVNLEEANLTGASFAGVNSAPATVWHANVSGLAPGSAAFCRFAMQHGAVQMSDEDWKAWRSRNFVETGPEGAKVPAGVTLLPGRCGDPA